MGKRILIMQTKNWSEELKADEQRSLAEKISIYIGNTGNLMFLNGCKYIASTSGNICDFYDWYKMRDDASRYKEEINENYDAVICPMANILQGNVDFIWDIINLLKGISIPIYCLGIGISNSENSKINELCTLIQEPVLELIRIVDASGGKFACRGYITQEVLAKIGGTGSEGSVVVTGCPSMYQNGLLHIDKKEKTQLKVAVNGGNKNFKERFIRDFFKSESTVYIDQDEYCRALYGDDVELSTLMKRSYFGTRLLSEGRIKLFYYLPAWYSYIKNNVDFVFGSRIHGNLVALLAGKPAMVYLPPNADLRVKELAEFFEVPVTRKSNKDMYALYEEADYTLFNKNFEKKFNDFERFLVENNICSGLSKTQNDVLMHAGYEMQPETLNYDILKQQINQLGGMQRKLYEWKERYL